MTAAGYVPERGDLVWLNFNPQAGHDQAGKRPALILSLKFYNRKARQALVCPITLQVKGYPFEVQLPQGLAISGAILTDQVRSLDWHARGIKFVCQAPGEIIADALAKVRTLIA